MKVLAISLGGSIWQMDIIRRARELNLATLVADISADPPGRRFADHFVQIDTNDREGLLQIAKAYQARLVLAEQTDRVVPVAAYLNEHLGLNGIRPEVARRFTDKLAMRHALQPVGIPMPEFSEISSLAEAKQLVAHWGFPVVLKPKSSQSSMGVFKADTLAELGARLPETLRFSTDGKVLLEQFIEGTEITVEGFSLDGRCTVLAISEKEHYSFNVCVAKRLVYPPRFPDKVILSIQETAVRVVNTLGLRDGISHAEYRMRDGVPYLVEVAARGGGNRIASFIVPHVSGVDIYELLIRKLSGEHVTMPALQHRSANLEFFDFRPGQVHAIEGLEEVKAMGLAQDIKLSFSPGDVIEVPTDDRKRLGYFITLGQTRDEVDEKSLRVKEMIQICYNGVASA